MSVGWNPFYNNTKRSAVRCLPRSFLVLFLLVRLIFGSWFCWLERQPFFLLPTLLIFLHLLLLLLHPLLVGAVVVLTVLACFVVAFSGSAHHPRVCRGLLWLTPAHVGSWIHSARAEL